ncbi:MULTISPECIES: integration host factor, actinobacterial type [Micrococcus]|uniref:integration host factor, actinobacterial type n=1 Tax=Micrococcus TaxID=1269 RepID=UPI001CCBC6FF|nr:MULTISPECIES: integration host factor, actinobacterial type [Micrococcus]MCG7421242.1 DNA-binding protein [Micrococcus sp. ACRRV]UBH23799.1 DNA-binding protein [Micrococcus porci]
MALRQLSVEERAEARAKALRARQERATLKTSFANRDLSLQEVFARADVDPAIGRLRTVDLLQAMPGVGEVRASAVMEACEISPARRLKGLGRRQREALIAYIGR